MDNRLARFIDSDTPKLNPILAQGVAVSQLEDTERYIDSVIRAAVKSFPDGLEYIGCKRCTPQEEFQYVTTRGKSKKTYNIAKNNLYLMKYFFRYEGKDLEPRYVYLPYVESAGYITINGAKHLISPTLNDIVFSITKDSVFVRLLRDRMSFQRFSHTYLRGDGVAETLPIVWSPIHKKNSGKPSVNAKTTNMHYLLARFGFTETFKRFAGFEPVIGLDEINTDTYPEDQWVVCSTTTHRSPRVVGNMSWSPTRIRIAVPKEHYNYKTKSMIAGFYYVVDHFPNRVKPQWVDSERLWKVLLALMIYPAGVGEGTLYENINEHFKSLDQYLDSFVIQQLRDIGYWITDIYQILDLTLEKFSEWLTGSSDKINSIYDKELNVNYFVLFSITSGIFQTVYRLNQRLTTRRTLSADDINRVFNSHFGTMRIFKITKENAEVSSLTVPNDNKALRLSQIMVPQSANESKRKTNINLNDPAIRLHPSVAEVGGFVVLPKRMPDGRSRLNLCVNVENYRIVRNPDLKPLLDQIQDIIRVR